jgi:hypothetical protein
LHGDFFATCDRRTGDLVVKLDEEKVTQLVDWATRNRSHPTVAAFVSGPPSRTPNGDVSTPPRRCAVRR